MLIKESNHVPVQVLEGLKVKYFVQSNRNCPVRLEIDIMPSGAFFLNLFISRYEDRIYRLLIEISESRLRLLSEGGISLDYAFINPENNFIYAALFDEEYQIVKLSWVSPSDLKYNCPIPSDLYVIFDVEPMQPPFRLLQHARSRGKITVEVYLSAKGLKSNLRYWALKNFLIPFAELVKTAITDQKIRYPQSSMEEITNYGFSLLTHGSLHAVIELDCKTNLFGENPELENLVHFFHLLLAEDKGEILETLGYFQNRKIIPDYIRVLRSIAKYNSLFTARLASPFREISEVVFDKQRSSSIKSIIESSLPETEYDEIITGTLTCLDFGNKKRPVFSLNSALDNRIYNGYIDPGLDDFMNTNGFQFCTKNYECTLRTFFFPESLKSPEQYRHILLRIDEVPEHAQETPYIK